MLNKSSFHLPVSYGMSTYCSKLYDVCIEAKTRIQVKSELLEVSTYLWITAQKDISIKPTGPPLVFIPHLPHLAFLPTELFHF